VQELARAARSAEKFFDTLSRELPPTLKAIRNTSLEITDLTDDVSEGVKSAGQVVKQVDQSLNSAKKQAQNIQVSTRSLVVGVKAAWKTFTHQKPARRNPERLSMNDKPDLTLPDRELLSSENRRIVDR
jgi:ABC-type transporter Mla subunit MlaD